MNINIIKSGSSGNCIILTDSNKNQIMLDCGIKYELIMPFVDFNKINFICLTHEHKDHSLSKKQFENFSIDIYSPENVSDGKLIDTTNWKVLPIRLRHNVECFGFLIYNKIENKKIAYITDTTIIPKLNKVDCLIIETNWSEDYLMTVAEKYIIQNKGYLNHLSQEQVTEYLETTNLQPKILVLSHLSNSGLINIKTLNKEFKKYAENVYIALPNTNIEF